MCKAPSVVLWSTHHITMDAKSRCRRPIDLTVKIYRDPSPGSLNILYPVSGTLGALPHIIESTHATKTAYYVRRNEELLLIGHTLTAVLHRLLSERMHETVLDAASRYTACVGGVVFASGDYNPNHLFNPFTHRSIIACGPTTINWQDDDSYRNLVLLGEHADVSVYIRLCDELTVPPIPC